MKTQVSVLISSLFIMGASFFDPIGRLEKHEHLQKILNLDELQIKDETKRGQAHEIKDQIVGANEKVREKINELSKLEAKQASLCDDFWWFLDPDQQLEVQKMQVEINQQEREIASLHDQMELLWRQLKPLFGVRSRLFGADAFLSMTSVIRFLVNVMVPVPLTFSFVILLIFGPLALAVLSMIFAMGWVILPAAAMLLVTFWAVHMPMVISQYAPSTNEFVFLYTLGMVVLAAILSAVTYVTSPYNY